jgi:hypothetical protein
MQTHTLPMTTFLSLTSTQVFWFFVQLKPGNPTGLVSVFEWPYDCTVSDFIRVGWTPTPFPYPRSSLSLGLRSFGFFVRSNSSGRTHETWVKLEYNLFLYLILINERLCNLNKWQTGFSHTLLTPHSTPNLSSV